MSFATPSTVADSLAEVKFDDRVENICGEILDLPPSCIEFSLAEPEYFVIGTYNLEKDEASEVLEDEDGDEGKCEDVKAEAKEKKAQSRNGSLMLWRYADREM
jgi:diphthamide biosynthesis protein 7